MKRIELTPSAHQAVLSRANPAFTFLDTSVPLPNGNRRIEIGDDTYARLAQIKLPGESFSDAIERLCAVAGRPAN